MDQTCWWPAAKPRHRQCVGHDVSGHARLQRPSHHISIKQINHDGQVQQAFIRPQIGDISRPDLVLERWA